MGNIEIEARDDRVHFRLSEGRATSSFSIPAQEAEELAIRLLEMTAMIHGPRTEPLLHQIPMATQENPRVEHRPLENGKHLIAIQVGNWRPFYFILPKSWISGA